MGRETGNGEGHGDEMDFPVIHCQWGKKRTCGKNGSIPQMSCHAAVHGALCLIASHRECRLRFGRHCVVMVMLVRWTIAVRRCFRGVA
jgi:hypothetical protein